MEWDEYKNKIKSALDAFEFDPQIIQLLKDSRHNNQKIFVGGNGGSAAIALHYVCDLSKGASSNWENNNKRYQAICLSSNLGYMTAISNDADYNQVFKQQLINLASKDDLLVLISSSGNSPNVVEAATWAKENGMKVIGLTGFSGGKLKEIAHHSGHITSDYYEVCEDIHHIFGQFLACHLREHEESQQVR